MSPEFDRCLAYMNDPGWRLTSSAGPVATATLRWQVDDDSKGTQTRPSFRDWVDHRTFRVVLTLTRLSIAALISVHSHGQLGTVVCPPLLHADLALLPYAHDPHPLSLRR